MRKEFAAVAIISILTISGFAAGQEQKNIAGAGNPRRIV